MSLKSRNTRSGADYLSINPKGYVPALGLDDGSVLTEGPAILQFLADHKPEAHLAPPQGSIERYRVIEWLAYLNSEIHKTFGLFFTPGVGDEEKKGAGERLAKKFDWLRSALGDREFVTYDRFTIVDAYLHTMLTWAPYHQARPDALAAAGGLSRPNRRASVGQGGAGDGAEGGISAASRRQTNGQRRAGRFVLACGRDCAIFPSGSSASAGRRGSPKAALPTAAASR